MDTPAKRKVMLQYLQFAEWISTQVPQQAPGVWNWQILNSAMNNENQKAQTSMWATPWL